MPLFSTAGRISCADQSPIRLLMDIRGRVIVGREEKGRKARISMTEEFITGRGKSMLDKKSVGRRIAYYRKDKGFSQKELADSLNISYQSVSKWEAGYSLPTVEMLYEMANILNVTVDLLLNDSAWENRWIRYTDTGLDTKKLYELKRELMELNSDDERIFSAEYAEAYLFRMDTASMKDPIYASITCTPGSKERLAAEYRYNREICADAVAGTINLLLQYGVKSMILKGMIVCGNYNQDQLRLMAEAMKDQCRKNDVIFAGMEIAAQPVNYGTEEYHINVTLTGVQDREKILDGSQIREGDILIGIRSDGIDGTNYPIIKVMLDRKPRLFQEKLDEKHLFLDELMKPGNAFVREIRALQGQGLLHGAVRVLNSMLKRRSWRRVPEGLGACIDLCSVPVFPLHRFLFQQDMIGERVFPYHFNMGIGMIAVAPEGGWREAMEIIGQFSPCWRIGRIMKDTGHEGEKVWTEGRILW